MNYTPKRQVEDHYISIEEKDSILSFLLQEYNLDLTEYSEASVRRRITKMLSDFGVEDGTGLKSYLTNKRDGKAIFLEKFTVNVTEMFRDPAFYAALVKKVFPLFRKKKRVKIWSAGCSTGEEILSLVILLHEHGLLEKCEILGTDLNEEVISQARSGTYKLRHIKEYMKPYLQAGGKYGLEEYFITTAENVHFEKYLLTNISFGVHNLLDPINDTFDLILCRNVLIYFNGALQGKVLSNLKNSLNKNSVLALGSKESLIFYDDRACLQEIDIENRIYRKVR